MFKLIIGFFAGMILTGALFMGSVSATPAKEQTEDSSLVEMLPDLAQTYRKSLTSPLQAAGDEIRDNDTGQFYRKLLREYDLDEPSPGIAQTENSSLTEVLPDIKNINYVAITLPLQEARKNIQDEDIAQFYYKFLQSVGLAIESN